MTTEPASSNVRPFRKPQALCDDAATASGSLGCIGCVDEGACGGAHMAASFFGCIDHCRCADKTSCDLVCRNNPAAYVERLREVGGFDLHAAPRTRPAEVEPLPSMIPLVDHSSAREGALNFPIVAVPLHALLDLDKGRLRFADRKALAAQFGIDPLARLVVSGVARDRKIERYWASPDRPALLASLRDLEVALITPPNFSVLTGVPRTDNLHAMKRIMLAFCEMAEAGLPAALHLNARTERDYARWAEVIAARPEIDCVTVEFATGAGRGPRIDWHAANLEALASRVGRPLRLVVRGGNRVLETLRRSFRSVTLIDTAAFAKTRCRKQAWFTDAGKLTWRNHPTAEDEPLDALLQHNVATLYSHHTHLERLHADRRLAASSAHLGPADHGNRQAV
jgi:hypothetical protein